MPNAKDIDVKNIKLKVLVYGKSGTGKTTFACSFPRPYIFDFDNGMLSQRGKDVDYDTYTNWQAFQFKLQQFEKECPYETLIVDSVTMMQEYSMQNILALNKRLEPTLHEWGRLVDSLQGLFMRMTKMAHHVIFTAHEQVLQDEVTSEILVLPLIVGRKLPGQIPLWFDECWRMQVTRKEGRPVYQALTTADIKYSAKSRLGVMSAVEDWPTYDKIMEKVKGATK